MTTTSYVSIESDINISCQPLSDCSPLALKELFHKRSSTIGLYSQIEYQREELTPALRRLEQENPDIAQWITFIQSSIESVAAVVNDISTDTDTCHRVRVSLSAVGMEVDLTGEFTANDYVQLVLELPDKARMMVIARVACAQPTNGAATRVKFDFEYIRISDQEMLIRHIHQTQIEELQQLRRIQTSEHATEKAR